MGADNGVKLGNRQAVTGIPGCRLPQRPTPRVYFECTDGLLPTIVECVVHPEIGAAPKVKLVSLVFTVISRILTV
jgi:hypothetical protein